MKTAGGALRCQGQSSGGLRATICRPGELGAAEIEQWHAFQRASFALDHPFSSPEFAIALGGLRSEARVAVVESEGALAGFFPFVTSRLFGARPIAERLAPRQAFVHAPGLSWSWPDIARAACIPVIHLVGVVEPEVPGLERALKVESSLVDLSGGLAAYWETVGGRRSIKIMGQKRRKLERTLGLIELRIGAPSDAELGELLEWKSAQARRNGWGEPFRQPWKRELVAVLAASERPGLSGVFASLRVGGVPVASDLSLRSPTVLVDWIRAYDNDYARFSPGSILFMELLDLAAKAGVDAVDLGIGNEPFKQSWRNARETLGIGAVRGRGARSAIGYAPVATRQWGHRFVLDHASLHRVAHASLRSLRSTRSLVHGHDHG